jgi:hypothetical protein
MMVDPQKARNRLLPRSGWRPWQKPRPALPIDEWVAKQNVKRGDLPAHLEQDACPYWYVRSGVATAAGMATQQAAQWAEKQVYIQDALSQYGDLATDIAKASESLRQMVSGFWQLHLSINGNLFRFDSYKAAGILTKHKPEIERAEVLHFMQQLAILPETLKLQDVTKASKDARKPWFEKQGDVWKHIFVGHLGLIWSDLMKRPPTNSDPFRGFVADAWASLDGHEEANFDRAVRKIAPRFRRADGP